MAHFIYDKTGMPIPKVNARPLRVPPDQGVVAAEWNQVGQALLDVQGVLLGGKFYGLAKQGGQPAVPAGTTDFFWLDNAIRLHLFSTADWMVPVVGPLGALVKGDLFPWSGTDFERLPAGADGQVLRAKAAAALGVEWGAGMGQAGQLLLDIVPGGGRASHDSATPRVVGAFAFDPTKYTLAGTDRLIFFRALVASGNATKTVHVLLRNLTDGEDVGGTDLTTTSTATVKLEAALNEGANPGQVKPAEKIYEVRIWVDAPAAPTDTVELYGAELRVQRTIQ